jgi:glycosyltransferase involved in cell wall biosynthesis
LAFDQPPPQPLRLLHINSATKWIGEAAHTFELCRGLMERGHEVTLCCRPDSELAQRARVGGVAIEPLHLGRGFRWGEELSDWRRLRELIAERRPQIVHAHRGKDHWVAAGAMLGRSSGPGAPQLVRTRHVVTPTRPHLLNTWIFGRRTAMLFAVSRAAAGSLGRYWEAAARRVVVQPGVDLERFHPGRRDLTSKEAAFGIPPQAPLVALVGRVQRIKGQQVFLKAARRLAESHPTVHFLCAGRHQPDRGDKLRQQGNEGALKGRWHVVGWLDDIPGMMASLDVGVVASLGSEGASRVTLEYLASGLPVVGTRVGGIPDISEISSEFALELVAPGDDLALAEAIERALPQDRVARAETPRIYREEPLKLISRERWLDEMEAAYLGLLASFPPSA